MKLGPRAASSGEPTLKESGKGADRGRVQVAKKPRAKRTDYVRISRYETASLWMLADPAVTEPRVVSFHCPTCPDPDNSRLLHINIPTEPKFPHRGNARRTVKPPHRTLLHVTRAQIEQILADFGK